MPEILHQLSIKASPGRVYQALTEQKGLANWWTHFSYAEPRIDSVAEFEFDGGKTKIRMKIIKLLANRQVVWHCLGGPPEWISTQIAFDLEVKGNETIIHFAHRGWRSTAGTFPSCNYDWGRYLSSLRAYLEKGRGFPVRS